MCCCKEGIKYNKNNKKKLYCIRCILENCYKSFVYFFMYVCFLKVIVQKKELWICVLEYVCRYCYFYYKDEKIYWLFYDCNRVMIIY